MADANFMANSRQWVPALLAEVRSLRATTLTDEELAAIEKACAEATPGPWFSTGSSGPDILQGRPGFAGEYIAALHAETELDTWSGRLENGEFIAKSRQWVPALLAKVTAGAEDMRTRCLNVVEDTARQLDEMGEHEKAECVRTIIPRLEALP